MLEVACRVSEVGVLRMDEVSILVCCRITHGLGMLLESELHVLPFDTCLPAIAFTRPWHPRHAFPQLQPRVRGEICLVV
jgi:hypothetical protein